MPTKNSFNDPITDRHMNVLCTYPLAKSGAAEVLDVVQAHQFAIARRQGKWEVIETPELIHSPRNSFRVANKLKLKAFGSQDCESATLG